LSILERAHRLHPRHFRIASALTDCYVVLGRPDDERRMLMVIHEILLEVLAREPNNVDARVFLAIELAQSGHGKEGIEQAEKAIGQAPGDGRVRYNAACAFSYAGELDRAMEQLKAMVAMLPSYLKDWIRRDPDLKALHGREDFQRLFGES
jgi:thioredoxin-like negative regulator of GroEL